MHTNSVEDEILAVLRAESAAFFRGDFEEFARHWEQTPDAGRMNSGPHTRTRISRGWHEIGARMGQAMRLHPQHFDAEKHLRWDNIVIRAGTDMAWVTHDSVVTQAVEGIATTEFQHELKILHRVDGVWKLAFISIVVPGIGGNDTPHIEIGKDKVVCYINMRAQERLDDHPGLIISGEKVRARQRAFDPRLQREIDNAVACLETTFALGSDRLSTVAVPLGEDDFAKPLYCWVSIEQERVLVTFDDARMTEARLELAAEVFALSPAQQKLAVILTSGSDLSAAGAELGVSVNTVRTQLRRMFEKTGTHNQTELISALLSVQQPT